MRENCKLKTRIRVNDKSKPKFTHSTGCLFPHIKKDSAKMIWKKINIFFSFVFLQFKSIHFCLFIAATPEQRCEHLPFNKAS